MPELHHHNQPSGSGEPDFRLSKSSKPVPSKLAALDLTPELFCETLRPILKEAIADAARLGWRTFADRFDEMLDQNLSAGKISQPLLGACHANLPSPQFLKRLCGLIDQIVAVTPPGERDECDETVEELRPKWEFQVYEALQLNLIRVITGEAHDRILGIVDSYWRGEEVASELYSAAESGFLTLTDLLKSFEVFRIARDLKTKEERISDPNKAIEGGAYLKAGVVSRLGEHESCIRVPALEMLSGAIALAKFHLEELASLGKVDIESLDRERLEYGGKGATLRVLRRISPHLNAVAIKCCFQVSLPDFETVPARLYDESQGDPFQNPSVFQVYFDWIAGREVLIRSSAVHSEDGALLGAGIYKSVRLLEGASFNDFLAAVKAVYDSVQSEDAVTYRSQNGIPSESMGLIIQDFKRNCDEFNGQVNTVRKAVPQLVEVLAERQDVPSYPATPEERVGYDEYYRDRFLLDRNKLAASLLHLRTDSRNLNEGPFLTQPDFRSPVDHLAVFDVAKLALLVEHYFGGRIQIEAGVDKNEIYLFQARTLPPAYLIPTAIKLPENTEPIFIGQGLGPMDLELPILSPADDNREREGVLVLGESAMIGLRHQGMPKMFPARGAVVLLMPSKEMSGHIESLALQKDLCLIFHGQESGLHETFRSRLVGAWGSGPVSELLAERTADCAPGLGPTKTLRSLRVVCDGLRGAIYLP